MMLLALRNRPHAERRALMLLRGAPLAVSRWVRRVREMPDPTPALLRRFIDLRCIAEDHGLAIRSPGMPYVGKDELRLLAWMRHHRIAPPSSCQHRSPRSAVVMNCGWSFLAMRHLRPSLATTSLFGPSPTPLQRARWCLPRLTRPSNRSRRPMAAVASGSPGCCASAGWRRKSSSPSPMEPSQPG